MAIAVRATSAPTISGPAASSLVLDTPSGVQAGDYLVAFLHSQTTGASTDSACSGWTRIGAAFIASDTSTRVTGMYAKFATGSEPSTFSFSVFTSANRNVGFITALTGVDSTTPVAASTSYSTSAILTDTLSVSAFAGSANLYTLEICASNYSTGAGTSYALSSYDGGLSLLEDGFFPSGAENTGVSRSAIRGWGGMAPGGGIPAHSVVTVGNHAQSCAYLVALNAAPELVPISWIAGVNT